MGTIPSVKSKSKKHKPVRIDSSKQSLTPEDALSISKRLLMIETTIKAVLVNDKPVIGENLTPELAAYFEHIFIRSKYNDIHSIFLNIGTKLHLQPWKKGNAFQIICFGYLADYFGAIKFSQSLIDKVLVKDLSQIIMEYVYTVDERKQANAFSTFVDKS